MRIDLGLANGRLKAQVSWAFTTVLFVIIFVFAWIIVEDLLGIRPSRNRGGRQPLSADTAVLNMGLIGTNQQKTAKFTLTNSSNAPVRILGAATGCICTVPKDLPFSIEHGQKRGFEVIFKSSRNIGAFKIPVSVHTDSRTQPELVLEIEGTVID